MNCNNLLTVKTRTELREWLLANSRIEKECWVIASVKSVKGTLLYLDAVEEALCVGWIDSVKKKIDGQVAQCLSPRAKRSPWTELNKERVRRLEKLGLMTEVGRLILPEMDLEAFVIDPVIEERLKSEHLVYQNFLAFPSLYQRIRIDTIQSYKMDTELFNKRLNRLIEQTRQNKLYGTWNDDGRLLDY